MAVSEMRERVADVMREVAYRRQRVVLTRHGREVGAIVPLEDLERLRALDAVGDEPSRTLSAYRASWSRLADRLGGALTRDS